MLNKTLSFFTSKRAIFVGVIFLVFFPIKTQAYNVLTYIFDQLFLGGKVSEIFTYNFVGELIGCTETVLISKHVDFSIFVPIYIIIKFLISVVFWWLIYRNYKNNKTSNWKTWIYVFIFSFYLFDALEYTFNAINYYSMERIIQSFVSTGTCIITLILAAHIFFKLLKSKEKMQLLFIAFPASIISGYFWFNYIGPKLLPIITLL